MERIIKFRGKRIDNGEWVYGSLLQSEIDVNHLNVKAQIHERFAHDFSIASYDVDPKTVGQFTELLDKNGKEIFEGDILRTKIDVAEYCINQVAYQPGLYGWIGEITGKFFPFTDDSDLDLTQSEVIGNIHGTPELLKKAE